MSARIPVKGRDYFLETIEVTYRDDSGCIKTTECSGVSEEEAVKYFNKKYEDASYISHRNVTIDRYNSNYETSKRFELEYKNVK